MSLYNSDSNSSISLTNPQWKILFKTGAIFSILTVVSIILSIISFFIWPPFPNDIFSILNQNHFSGIMSLDVLYLVSVLFTLPLILNLFIILKHQNESLALIAFILGLIGVILVILSRPIVEMVSISDKYSQSINESEKLAYLAAGKATLELFNGTSYYLHILFGNISFLISASLMIKSVKFSKLTAILGIITNIIAFGIFIPFIGPFFGFVFLIGFIPWLLLISISLFKFSK